MPESGNGDSKGVRRFLRTTGDDKTVRVWSVETGALAQRIEDLPDTVRSICAIDDFRFAVSYDNGKVEILAITNTVDRRCFTDTGAAVTAMTTLNDTGLIVLCTDDGSLEFRRLDDAGCAHRLTEHQSAIVTVTVVLNECRMYTLDDKGNVRRWILDWTLSEEGSTTGSRVEH